MIREEVMNAVPLGEFLGVPELSATGDCVVLVPWTTVVYRRFVAWLWPRGFAAVTGACLLLLRDRAVGRLSMSVVLLALCVVLVPLFALVYPRTLSNGGFPRLCWVMITRDASFAFELFEGAKHQSRLAPLVLLPGGRGVALIGAGSVPLSDRGIKIVLEASKSGRVCRAEFHDGGTIASTTAYGRLPVRRR